MDLIFPRPLTGSGPNRGILPSRGGNVIARESPIVTNLLSLTSTSLLQVAIVIRHYDITIYPSVHRYAVQRSRNARKHPSARIFGWLHSSKRCTICMNVCIPAYTHNSVVRLASWRWARYCNGRTMHVLPLCAYRSHLGGTVRTVSSLGWD